MQNIEIFSLFRDLFFKRKLQENIIVFMIIFHYLSIKMGVTLLLKNTSNYFSGVWSVVLYKLFWKVIDKNLLLVHMYLNIIFCCKVEHTWILLTWVSCDKFGWIVHKVSEKLKIRKFYSDSTRQQTFLIRKLQSWL